MDLPVVEVKDNGEHQILDDVKKIVGVIFGMLLLLLLCGNIHIHISITMDAMLRGKPCSLAKTSTRVVELTSALRKTIRLKQGQVLVHPGELHHKGIDITYGVRCLLVCFTDGMNPKIMDDSRQEDDDPKYEANVLVC